MFDAAADAREAQLAVDPTCEVKSEKYVRFRRCRAPLKLSCRSLFQPFRWLKHKKRCKVRDAAVHEAHRRKAQVSARSPRAPFACLLVGATEHVDWLIRKAHVGAQAE
jgi:hypothetical protein